MIEKIIIFGIYEKEILSVYGEEQSKRLSENTELNNIVRICLLGLFNGLEMIRVSKIAIVPSDFEFVSKNVFKIPNYYNKRNYDVWYRTTIENLTFDIKEDNIDRTKLNFMEMPKVSIQQEFEF